MSRQHLVILEDGDTYAGAENSSIVEIDDDVELEEYEDWRDVPVMDYLDVATIGQLRAATARLLDAGKAIIAADSPDHTAAPTDEQWRELEAALADRRLSLWTWDAERAHIFGPEGCNGIYCPEPNNPDLSSHITDERTAKA